MANAVAEACWLRQLLCELHHPLLPAIVVYCDNVSAVSLSTKSVQHQRTKHVEIDLHFVHEQVVVGAVCASQYADIFTKGLLTALFQDFRSSLNLRSCSELQLRRGGGVVKRQQHVPDSAQ